MGALKGKLLAGSLAVLVAGGLLYVSTVLCSSAVTQWSPEAQARATIMLRETLVPTAQPVATVNPTVIAAWDGAQASAARTSQVGVVVVVVAGCVMVTAVFASIAAQSISAAARHAKATAKLMPMARLPAGTHAQFPGGVYDKRTDRWTQTGDEDKEGENELLRIEAGAGVGKIEALARLVPALLRPIPRGATPMRMTYPALLEREAGDIEDGDEGNSG